MVDDLRADQFVIGEKIEIEVVAFAFMGQRPGQGLGNFGLAQRGSNHRHCIDAQRFGQGAKPDAVLLRLEDANGLFDRLRADTTRQSSVTPRPIKSRTWLPLIFLALLTVEWLFRLRFNMA